MSSPIKDCLNCEEDGGTCYECYILSGQEEKDLRASGADSETLKIFGYKDLIYCPMCETEHENNTMCQANFEPDHSPE